MSTSGVTNGLLPRSIRVELLQTSVQQCPWCGESIELTIDCSFGDHAYVEDCSVCCAPMLVDVDLAAGLAETPIVEVRREGD